MKGELRRHGDPDNVSCALTLDFSLIVSAKLGDIEALTLVLQGAVDEVIARCKVMGHDAYLRVGNVHPVTHEELLAVMPRKIHYVKDGRQICTTSHVSPKNLSTDDEQITCKLCRKLRGLP